MVSDHRSQAHNQDEEEKRKRQDARRKIDGLNKTNNERSVLIASMPEAGFDFKTALANFKTKYGDEAYSKLRGVGNNTWSAFTDNVTQMYADGPPAHEKQSSGKPPTDDEKKMSVIVALEVAAAGHADGDCRQGVLLCGAVWLFGVLGGWVECGLGCRLGVGLAVGGVAYNEIDGGPLAQQASLHTMEKEAYSTSRGAPSVEAFWTRGAPSVSLSTRYWPGTSVDGSIRCDPHTNAQYTGFHAEGGSFCRGRANVDAGNQLRLSLQSASGALSIDLEPTGFILSVQHNASAPTIRATSRTGVTYQLVPSASSSRGNHRIKTVRHGHTVTHLLVTDVAWAPIDGVPASSAPGSDHSCSLELIAWADCFTIELHAFHRDGALAGPLDLTTFEIRWAIGGEEHVASSRDAVDDASEPSSVALRLCTRATGRLARAVSSPPPMMPSATTDGADVAGTVCEGALVSVSYEGVPLDVQYHHPSGECRACLPPSFPKCIYQHGCAPTHDIHVRVARVAGALPNEPTKQHGVRLVLHRNFHRRRDGAAAESTSRPGAEVTGMSAAWFDATGSTPTGRPVQISKNWHAGGAASAFDAPPYAGVWWTVQQWVDVPAGSSGAWSGVCRIYYSSVHGADANSGRSTPLAAVSHAQLSLLGYGGDGLWEQVAHGSGGETMTLEPYGEHRASIIDDLRPGPSTCGTVKLGARCNTASDCVGAADRPALRPFCLPANASYGASRVSRCSPATSLDWRAAGLGPSACPAHTWTRNIGGGDALVYFDEEGRYVPKGRGLRTRIDAVGPLLTRSEWIGKTLDEAFEWRWRMSSPATGDVVRHFIRLSIRVLRDVRPSRLAFFSLAADGYDENRFAGVAVGGVGVDVHNIDLRRLTASRNGHAYVDGYWRRPLNGSMPHWFALHSSSAAHTCDDGAESCEAGGVADRGLVLRSWRARLGGPGREHTPPHWSLVQQRDASIFGGVALPNLEIAPPPEVHMLHAGDFVELDVEILVVPGHSSHAVGIVDAVTGGTAATRAQRAPLARRIDDAEAPWRLVELDASTNNLHVLILGDGGTLSSSYPIEVRVPPWAAHVQLRVNGSGIGSIPFSLVGERATMLANGGVLCWRNSSSATPSWTAAGAVSDGAAELTADAVPQQASSWRPVPGERQAQQVSPAAVLMTSGRENGGAGDVGGSVGEEEMMLTWLVRLAEGGGSVDFLWCSNRLSSPSTSSECAAHTTGDTRGPLVPPHAPPHATPAPSMPSSRPPAIPTPLEAPWSAPLAPLGPSEPRAPQMPPSHPFYPPSVLVSGVQLFVGLALGLAFLAALLLVQARRRPPAHQSETTIRKRINDGVIRVAWRIRHPKVLAPRLYDRPCASRSRQGWRSFDDVEPSGGAELSSVVQGVANE